MKIRPGVRAGRAVDINLSASLMKGNPSWHSPRSVWGWRSSPCFPAWSPRATGSDHDAFGVDAMLYLTAVLTVAALFYLGYAMIRPESF
jgi:hypothetical protein